jgi:hypothetical protein
MGIVTDNGALSLPGLAQLPLPDKRTLQRLA